MSDKNRNVIRVDFINLETGGKARLTVQLGALNDIVLREALKRSTTQQTEEDPRWIKPDPHDPSVVHIVYPEAIKPEAPNFRDKLCELGVCKPEVGLAALLEHKLNYGGQALIDSDGFLSCPQCGRKGKKRLMPLT